MTGPIFMEGLNATLIFELVAGALAVLSLYRIITRKSPLPLPPGPKPLPVIGNIRDVPAEYEWETYAKWSETYGDVMMLNLFGQPLIILSSLQAANDLLEKRSAIYSDRPKQEMAGVLVGYEKTLPLTSYGDRLRRLRRLFSQCIGTRALMKGYAPLMEWATHDFLLRTLRSPESFRDSLQRSTSMTILSVSHGYKVQEGRDRFLVLGDAVSDEFAELAVPGAFLVDAFPILKYVPSWLPGAGWKRTIPRYRKVFLDAVEEPFEFTKKQIEKGIAYPSFVSRNLTSEKPSLEHEEDVKYAAMSMYTAGSGTIVATMDAFLLAMTLYPDIQRKAQEEIERVIGNDRLPCADDWDTLPYVKALCLETLRWLPIGPLGLPHSLAQDDTYNGYFFPKGSIFFVNGWKIFHDPAIYHSPWDFIPERFIADPSTGYEPEEDPSHIAFGWGRRSCPGIQVAQLSLFLHISMTMAVFNVSPAKDEHGKDIVPEVKQMPGLLSRPRPYKCTIRPRSESAEALVLAANEAVQDERA